MFEKLFSSKGAKKPENVSDEVLYNAISEVVTAMELQLRTAIQMAAGLPDGNQHLHNLTASSFYYGYVTGLTNRIGAARFSEFINNSNLGHNLRRLLHGVVANIMFRDGDPDWDVVQLWEAQSVSYGTKNNEGYEEGVKVGMAFGEEIISGKKSSAITLLAAWLAG